MVLHTLAAFAKVKRLAGVLVVVSEGDAFFEAAAVDCATILVAACGGSTRATSVFNGLNALLQKGASVLDWVLVHDGVRFKVMCRRVRPIFTTATQALDGIPTTQRRRNHQQTACTPANPRANHLNTVGCGG
jgi:2-C-methyl-D-erythritol 4-phosphate cytidylyltransferase